MDTGVLAARADATNAHGLADRAAYVAGPTPVDLATDALDAGSAAGREPAPSVTFVGALGRHSSALLPTLALRLGRCGALGCLADRALTRTRLGGEPLTAAVCFAVAIIVVSLHLSSSVRAPVSPQCFAKLAAAMVIGPHRGGRSRTRRQSAAIRRPIAVINLRGAALPVGLTLDPWRNHPFSNRKLAGFALSQFPPVNPHVVTRIFDFGGQETSAVFGCRRHARGTKWGRWRGRGWLRPRCRHGPSR